MTERTDQAKWERIVRQVKSEDTYGTKAGQWSARKSQYAVKLYKEQGGGYKGAKKASNSLTQWGKQDWQTKSGKKSSETGERYLPKKAIQALTPEEYRRTSAAKRKGTTQYVQQPSDISEKTKRYR